MSLLSKNWASDGKDGNEQGVSQDGGYNRGSEHVDLERRKYMGKCQGVRQLIRGQNSRLEPGAPKELWTSGEESYSQVGEKGIR